MKTILITGATDGIGLETAKKLVSMGYHLIIHGRSEEKLARAKSALLAVDGSVKVDAILADLSDFTAISGFVTAIKNQFSSLDVIINNAGIFKTPMPETPSGLDVRFVVNTIAPYIISKALLPILTDEGRVVNLSSAAQAPIDLSVMSGEIKLNDEFQLYAQSKLALTIWSQEMAKTLTQGQVMVAVNPGSLLASKMVKEGFGMAGNDLSIGVDVLVRAALSEEFAEASGKYFDNDIKQFAAPHPDAQNPNICAQVLAVVEGISQSQLTGEI